MLKKPNSSIKSAVPTCPTQQGKACADRMHDQGSYQHPACLPKAEFSEPFTAISAPDNAASSALSQVSVSTSRIEYRQAGVTIRLGHAIILREVTVVGAKCRKIFKIGKPFAKKVQTSLAAAKGKKAD